jgi:Asp-tRNA(Asn)/Glu-tRNA(Gln) amidotransferase A subunit family amidase
MYYEAARQHARMHADPDAPLSATLRDALSEGAAIPDAEYRSALAARAAMMEAARDLWPEYDAIICPPAPGVAPVGLHTTGDPSFATLWTLIGVPAISIPSGWSDSGLPYGLQLATAVGEDRRLLEVAHWCATALSPTI